MPSQPNDAKSLFPEALDHEAAERSAVKGDPNATTGSGPDSTHATLPRAASERYALGDEIARGGMGVIYRATDTALGREVAVKVLQAKFAPDSTTARRFADEAHIAAQIQHPGIPPVHDLGTLPDGRPFLAMKLIKGQTLEGLLQARPDVSAERGRFVATFEAVCQAIAYAHAHGVIHRDLKPANVMVGAFGEVQVMDWGLAKVLGARTADTTDPAETTAGTQVVSRRDSDGLYTEAGSVLGTPAFMPPEQAAGAVGKVDQRSDVFGLGAILAVILTGQPPFAFGSAETTRVKAAQGDVAECLARLDACGAEPELVALCKRCLSPRAAERPGHAGEVAAAVASLRQAAEERARAAELDRVRADGERLAAELRATEERKRRRVQRALSGAVGLLLVGGLAFGWWQAEQGRVARERQARNAEAVAGLLDQCEQALGAGAAAAAAVTLEAAQKRVAEGGAENHTERLARYQDDLAVLRKLDDIDKFRWTPVANKKFPKIDVLAPRYREALRHFRADPDTVGAEQAAARVAASAVREPLVAALDRLLWGQQSPAVRATLQVIDPDPFRDAVRDAVRGNDAAALAKLAGQAEALAQPAGFAAFLGEEGLLDVPERRRALLWAALQRHPGALGLLMGMGRAYPLDRWQGAAERVRWFQAAVAVAPTNAATHESLGAALYTLKDLDGAIAAYRESLRLDPHYAAAHSNLGLVLTFKGNLDGAIAELQEALRLVPHYVAAHLNLGVALRRKGNLKGAIAQFQEALRLDPNDATAHDSLGEALNASGDRDGAMAEIQEALRLDPEHASAHNNLGMMLGNKGDIDGAFPHFREAARLDPTLAWAHCNVGIVLERRGDLDGAITCYREAVRLEPKHPHAAAALPLAEQLRALVTRLPDVLAGKDKPKDPAEAIAFAQICTQPFQKRYADAARFYADAFAADPKLADNLKPWHRYNAACYAALAGCGKGTDAAKQDDQDRARLRGQALTWLRADLVLLRRRAGSGEAPLRQDAAAKLSHWLIDSDLVGLRPGSEQVPMPAEERAAWDALWADVRAALALAQKTPTATPGK
jgi:Flp pilus assembly protein TadD